MIIRSADDLPVLFSYKIQKIRLYQGTVLESRIRNHILKQVPYLLTYLFIKLTEKHHPFTNNTIPHFKQPQRLPGFLIFSVQFNSSYLINKFFFSIRILTDFIVYLNCFKCILNSHMAI